MDVLQLTPAAKEYFTKLALDYLNSTLEADRAAIHSLILNRVPCNTQLADHEHAVVEYHTLSTNYAIGALGLINGLLTTLGLPRVAANFDETALKNNPRDTRLTNFIVPVIKPAEPVPASDTADSGDNYPNDHQRDGDDPSAFNG